MPKFLVTAQAEYYIYVEAASEDEALEIADDEDRWGWRRTMNKPMDNMKCEVVPAHALEMIKGD